MAVRRNRTGYSEPPYGHDRENVIVRAKKYFRDSYDRAFVLTKMDSLTGGSPLWFSDHTYHFKSLEGRTVYRWNGKRWETEAAE